MRISCSPRLRNLKQRFRVGTNGRINFACSSV
uniref:Uncharacterized protein n=1 Tax=Arundo donax TaxID=35708 RepID=A0A0A9FZ64_ARUDO